MANKNIGKEGEGTQFKKGQSGNPNGRPRKWVSTLKGYGYSKSEINDAITNLMSMNVEELTEAFKDPNATVLEKTIANAIRKSIQKGDLKSLETLLDRVYGKPKQEIEQKVTKVKPPEIQFYKAGEKE